MSGRKEREMKQLILAAVRSLAEIREMSQRNPTVDLKTTLQQRIRDVELETADAIEKAETCANREVA